MNWTKKKAAKACVGSKELSAYILFNEPRPGIDPFGPENRSVFMPNRFSVSAKSPFVVRLSPRVLG